MGLMRSLFGPSKAEVWGELSRRVDGEFVDGGWLGNTKVIVDVGAWTLTLDSYTVSTGNSSQTFTRMRAPYVNADGFYFRIYRKSVFSGLGKLFGMQDIEIGEPEFDDPFILQSNDEIRLRRFLENERLRDLFHAQPAIDIKIKDDEGWFGATFPDGVDELYFSASGVIKDLDVLQDLFELFSESLDQLCRIGSAYGDNPGVTL